MEDGYREPGTGQLLAKGSSSRKRGGSEGQVGEERDDALGGGEQKELRLRQVDGVRAAVRSGGEG